MDSSGDENTNNTKDNNICSNNINNNNNNTDDNSSSKESPKKRGRKAKTSIDSTSPSKNTTTANDIDNNNNKENESKENKEINENKENKENKENEDNDVNTTTKTTTNEEEIKEAIRQKRKRKSAESDNKNEQSDSKAARLEDKEKEKEKEKQKQKQKDKDNSSPDKKKNKENNKTNDTVNNDTKRDNESKDEENSNKDKENNNNKEDNKVDNEDDNEKTEPWEDEEDNEPVEPKEPIDLTKPLSSDETFTDTWNNEFVRLPFSSFNTFRKKSNPNKALSRWDLICTVLKEDISDSSDLEEVVKAYNSRKGFDFSGLHDFFDSECDEVEAKGFFSETLPKMIALAMALPSLIIRPIPLLMKHVDQEILFNQRQLASILANAFLCTFPAQGAGDEINHYPGINFNTLYESPCTPRKAAKLKAIVHYFRRVTENMPSGIVSFHRQVLDDFPEWETRKELLPNLKIEMEGAIEDKGEGMLQVDFANKLIGGGVLGSGSVQEEIRFVVNTELIAARLFTSKMEDNEVVIIKGPERFSNYKGYSDNFEWVGDFEDKTPLDNLGRRDTTIVAMDAIHLKKPIKQYSAALLERELNKAFCGFHVPSATDVQLPPVATGHWGCGVFGGDRYLKSILQLMAAAIAKRDLVYFTFSDEEFGERLEYMYGVLRDKKVSVGSLYKSFVEFNALLMEAKSSLEIFDYLEVRFNS